MIVISNPSTHPAPQHLAADLASVDEVRYFTAFGVPDDSWLFRVPLPRRVRSELERRRLPFGLARGAVRSSAPGWALLSVAGQRAGFRGVQQFAIRKYARRTSSVVIRLLRRRATEVRAVVATAALSESVVTEARRLGIPVVLYLPLPHYQWLAETLEGFGVASTDALVGVSPYTSRSELDAEMAGADVFLGGSSMVRDSVTVRWPGRPIVIHVPGVQVSDLPQERSCIPDRRDRPTRLLYVGRASPQKGLLYLIEAMKLLSDLGGWELTIVSADHLAIREIIAQDAPDLPINVRGALPRRDVLRTMAEHDVFVLASLFEGFALVLAEALSAGLPVVATTMTGAADVEINGRAGIVVPPADPIALAAALRRLVLDRDLRRALAEAAPSIATQFRWEAYRREAPYQVLAAIDALPRPAFPR